MFSHIITCDLHIESRILNQMNIKKYLNDLKKISFPLQPFASTLCFHQVDIMNMQLHKGKHVFYRKCL
jgi:hypothetical protein